MTNSPVSAHIVSQKNIHRISGDPHETFTNVKYINIM